MWQTIQSWISDNWLPIVLTLVIGFAALKLGNAIVTNVVRRAVRNRSHGDISGDDVIKRQNTLIGMFGAIFKILVWLTVMFTILVRFGFDMSPLLAATGVVGLAVGFGAQSLIKDFITGLFIVLENQYRVGDVVDLNGASGTVESISIRTTILRDNDGSVHYIPNGTISHSINKTMGFANINLAVTVKSQTDVDELASIINKVGQKMADEKKWSPKIIDAPHFLSIGTFSDTTIEVKVTGKTEPSAQWSVVGELKKRLLEELKDQKIYLTDLSSGSKKK